MTELLVTQYAIHHRSQNDMTIKAHPQQVYWTFVVQLQFG